MVPQLVLPLITPLMSLYSPRNAMLPCPVGNCFDVLITPFLLGGLTNQVSRLAHTHHNSWNNMHMHDKNRPCKKEGPAVEKIVKTLGPRKLGRTTITKTTLIFGFFWVILVIVARTVCYLLNTLRVPYYGSIDAIIFQNSALTPGDPVYHISESPNFQELS